MGKTVAVGVLALALIVILDEGGGSAFILFMGVAAILCAVGYLVSSRPTRASAPVESSSELLQSRDSYWTKDAEGWLHWDATANTWMRSEPPPPSVLTDAGSVSESIRIHRQARVTVTIVAILIGVSSLAAWSLVDPHADIPVVSRIMCSLKGGAWYEANPITGPAGCYSRDPSLDF